MPSKEDYKKAYVSVICFYLKEIKDWAWPDIRKFFPKNEEYDELVSPISIGKKINKIKETLSKDLFVSLKNMDIDQLKKFKIEDFK